MFPKVSLVDCVVAVEDRGRCKTAIQDINHIIKLLVGIVQEKGNCESSSTNLELVFIHIFVDRECLYNRHLKYIQEVFT